MLSNMENLVIFGSLIYENGQNSLLGNLAFGRSGVGLYIVDERLNRAYAPSIVNRDQGMRQELQTLKALSGRENVNLVAKHPSEFHLSDSAKELDTVFVYYSSTESVGVKSEFDVMCLVNDFPRSASPARRRYILTDRSDRTDYTSVNISFSDYSSDLFAASGRVNLSQTPSDQAVITRYQVSQLTRALIEWMKSGFELERKSNVFLASVNVYNRQLVSGVTEQLRPNWVLNVETPTIKALIYSAGLDYRDRTVENATSFTDGVKTQSLMLHSADYRREVTLQAIELLSRFALENELFDRSADTLSVESWQDFLTRV